MQRLRPVLRVIVGSAFGLFLLASLARLAPELSPAALAERLREGDLGLLVVGGCVYLLVLPVRSMRWLALLRSAGSTLAPLPAIGLVARSWAVNILLPLRAGDLLRIASSGVHRLGRRAALGTIAAERIADLISLAAVGLIALLLDGPGLGTLRGPLIGASLVVGIGALSLLAIGALLRRRSSGRGRLSALAAPSIETLHLGASRSVIVRVLLLSSIAWVLEAASLVVAAQAIGVTGIGAADLAVAALVAAILATIPLTPAGIGLVEGGLFGLLRFGYGVDAESAAGVIVASRVVTLLPIIGAALFSTLILFLSSLSRRRRVV